MSANDDVPIGDPKRRRAVAAAIAEMQRADNPLAKLHALRNGAEANHNNPDVLARLEHYAVKVEGIASAVAKGAIEQGRDLATKAKSRSANAIEHIEGKSGAATRARTQPGDDGEIKRLAALSPLEYDRQRKLAAERLDIRTSVLDRLVEAERQKAGGGDGKQGRRLSLSEFEPWPQLVDGARLLTAIVEAINRYMVLPEGAAEAIALWCLHTHCFNCFVHSPRLAITSPEKGCGKTLLLDILRCLVARALLTANATVSAVFRAIDTAGPTLLIDEADTFLRDNEELRGILNAGHRKGGTVLRTVGDDHEPREFSAWAPAAIAMIGQLPDTLDDRSVRCRLRRRKSNERVASFRGDRAEHLHTLARKMARWTADNETSLSAADPNMATLQNRAADNWRPLFALADCAGGTSWPARVREIALVADTARTEQSTGVELLADCRTGFKERATDRLSSEDLAAYLNSLEDRPWPEFSGGRPLSKARLARLLGRFHIVPGTIRLPDSRTAKGYYRSAFEDAFASYLPSESVTTSQANDDGDCDVFQSVTANQRVTLPKSEKPNNGGRCDVVTATPRMDNASASYSGQNARQHHQRVSGRPDDADVESDWKERAAVVDHDGDIPRVWAEAQARLRVCVRPF